MMQKRQNNSFMKLRKVSAKYNTLVGTIKKSVVKSWQLNPGDIIEYSILRVKSRAVKHDAKTKPRP
jgi:hypothetical protein